jgi:hypothetical protein
MRQLQRILDTGQWRRAALVGIVGCLGWYSGPGTTWAAASGPPPAAAEYLQLIFSASADECRSRLKLVQDTHRAGQSARCLRNVSDQADQPPMARKLKPFALEVSGRGVPPPQVGLEATADTVTFRSLGEMRVAENPDRPDHQPLGSGAAGRYRMFVFTNPVDGQESDYNDWYDRQHVPDVLRVPGFLSGQRFAMADPDRQNLVKLPRYLALFELRSGGLAATDAEILARGRDGRTVNSSSFDLKSGVVAYMLEMEK